MKNILLREEIIPFGIVISLLILTTLFLDLTLHFFQLVWLGRYLGIPGVLFIILSFGYSLRKRRMIHFSSPKTMLQVHEVLSLIGALLLMVHAGVHFNAILPWLALIAMLINVISGLTGRVLLKHSQKRLKSLKAQLEQKGMSKADIDSELHLEAATTVVMKKWRKVHFPIAFIFLFLASLHVLSLWLLGAHL